MSNPSTISCILLPNEHLARRREIAGFECIEIDTTRYRLTELIFAVPIRCAASVSDTPPRVDVLTPKSEPTFHL